MLPVPGRRDSALSKADARILVLGPRNVGKSEFTYSCETLIENNKVTMEILDATSPPQKLTEKVTWADGFLLVYSVTDSKSFEEVVNLKEEIISMRHTFRPAIFIVGNKSDLSCERSVPKDVALQIVQELNCPFYECSASNSYEDVLHVFHQLYHETVKMKKEKRFSLSPRPLRKAFNKVFGGKTAT